MIRSGRECSYRIVQKTFCLFYNHSRSYPEPRGDTRMQIDLNCDMGEGFGVYTIGSDEQVMPFITSANIACGFHASDPETIWKTIKMAKANGVSVGAHPSYP